MAFTAPVSARHSQPSQNAHTNDMTGATCLTSFGSGSSPIVDIGDVLGNGSNKAASPRMMETLNRLDLTLTGVTRMLADLADAQKIDGRSPSVSCGRRRKNRSFSNVKPAVNITDLREPQGSCALTGESQSASPAGMIADEQAAKRDTAFSRSDWPSLPLRGGGVSWVREMEGVLQNQVQSEQGVTTASILGTRDAVAEFCATANERFETWSVGAVSGLLRKCDLHKCATAVDENAVDGKARILTHTSTNCNTLQQSIAAQIDFFSLNACRHFWRSKNRCY